MKEMSADTEQSLRQVFKYFNRFMVLLFRLGLGGWGNNPSTSQVMVLVHTGRKTGMKRRTPVNFARVEGEIYCTAAFGAVSHWYKNILANPHVEIWLPEGWWEGVAEVLPPDDPQRNAIMRQVLIASGFAASLFAGLNAKTVTEDDLEQLTANYRLIRIRRTGACTGPGGPGDLAWVWPLATCLLLAAFLLRPRKSSAP